MSCNKESSKALKIVWFILIVYPLVMTCALIDVGLRCINYVERTGPFEKTEFNYPMTLNGSQTFTFHLSIREPPPYGALFFEENYTFCNMRKISKPTLTRWEIIQFYLWFTTNETFDVWFISYDNHGNVVSNYTFSLWPGALLSAAPPYEVSEPETYTFEIKNCDTQDKHANLHIRIEDLVFEKPYFYYGILAIIVAVFYPTLLLIFILVQFKRCLTIRVPIQTDNAFKRKQKRSLCRKLN
ncbi:MAG: hypothetical protein QXG76_04315 [Candidatus Bathyarchaeia archaeon]